MYGRNFTWEQKMKEKKEIVENWLPRYTGTPLDEPTKAM